MATANEPGKPGWKSTEFWLTLAAIVVSALTTSGAIGEHTVAFQALTVIATILGSLGYAGARAWTKVGESKERATKAIAESGRTDPT